MTLELPDGSNQAARRESNIYAVIESHRQRAENDRFRSSRIAEKKFNMKYGGGMGRYYILWDQNFDIPTG